MKDLQYKYPVDALYTGCSLGNYLTFARFSKETDVRGLWSSTDNQFYLGEWNIEILVDGKPLIPKETLFSPESQTTFCGGEKINAEKQFFIPYGSDRKLMETPSVLQSLLSFTRLRNLSEGEVEFTIKHSLIIPARPAPQFVKQALADQTKKRIRVRQNTSTCEIVTEGRTDEVRIFGTEVAWESCSSDDQTVTAEYRIKVDVHQTVDIPFVFAYSGSGLAVAKTVYERCGDPRRLLNASAASYREILGRTHIVTPDPLINRGLQWAKINTVRVQHRFRTGDGFTNDPPQDIVVVRDVAWYVIGSDYVTPEFSRGLLTLVEEHGFHSNGKLTEYIHADELPAELHDYKLNINDDTPLYVYALYHHASIAGDHTNFVQAYPLMQRACNYILSQIRQGLVRCFADGVSVWGICSWRNIIDGYNLTGAVTEINAECCYALECCASAAQRIGLEADAAYYRQKASELKAAINAQLVSDKTGLYVLNLENNGTAHHDVTGDLIFPLMFGIADSEMRGRLLARLTDNEMWTPYGSRTVSKQEANYDPDFGYQLVGGLWPNLTAWVAFCIRTENPAKLIEGMRNIYKLCEPERPVDFVNVVPGEFPERIHGESYHSRGMAMSPWMPPTYLWLGVEGLLGFAPKEDGIEIRPALPDAPNWGWIAVKNLLFRGDSITAFLYDGILYSSHAVTSNYPVKYGTVIESSATNSSFFTIGMLVEGNVFLFVSAQADANGTVTTKSGKQEHSRAVTFRRGEAKLLYFGPASTQ